MNKRVMKLASRGKRIGAFFIDKIVPFVVLILVSIAAVGLSDLFYGRGYMRYGYGYGYNYDFGYSQQSPAASVSILVVGITIAVAYLVVQMVFYAKSQTIGKAILGMKVISSIDGEPVGFWKMLLREWFAKKASGVICGLGYLWVLIDDKNRGWHDKIVDTYVIDIKDSDSLKTGKDVRKEISEQAASDEADSKLIEETAGDYLNGPNMTAAAVEIRQNLGNEALVEATEPVKAAEKVEDIKVNEGMKKDELLAVAAELGISVPSKATKAEIIEIINKRGQ